MGKHYEYSSFGYLHETQPDTPDDKRMVHSVSRTALQGGKIGICDGGKRRLQHPLREKQPGTPENKRMGHLAPRTARG